VVLVGDPEQLQAIERGRRFGGLRLSTAWPSSRRCAGSGKGAAGGDDRACRRPERAKRSRPMRRRGRSSRSRSGRRRGAHSSRAGARDAKAEHKASQLVLAYTRNDVHELNAAIRTLREQGRQLGKGQEIATEQGTKGLRCTTEFGSAETRRRSASKRIIGHRRADRGRSAASEARWAVGYARGGRHQVLQASRSRLCSDRA